MIERRRNSDEKSAALDAGVGGRFGGSTHAGQQKPALQGRLFTAWT
jgi:hypothetical protein